MKRNSRPRRRSNSGITLIEMLVVVTIIALFAALVGVNVLQQGENARIVAAKSQIKNFQQALTLYKLDTGVFPSNDQGLTALRTRPEGIAQWNGPYIKEAIPMDPWGRPYQYKFPGDHGDEPDLVSFGPDGQPGGTDKNADIVSWESK